MQFQDLPCDQLYQAINFHWRNLYDCGIIIWKILYLLPSRKGKMALHSHSSKNCSYSAHHLFNTVYNSGIHGTWMENRWHSPRSKHKKKYILWKEHKSLDEFGHTIFHTNSMSSYIQLSNHEKGKFTVYLSLNQTTLLEGT